MTEGYTNGAAAPSEQMPDTGARGFDLDHDAYMADIADFNMSDEQAREFLETLWSIMRSFVEAGFTADICAHLFSDFNGVSDPAHNGASSSISPNTENPSKARKEQAQ